MPAINLRVGFTIYIHSIRRLEDLCRAWHFLPPYLTPNFMTNIDHKVTHDQQKEIEQLRAENQELRSQLARAKNPDPVKRPSFGRVLRLVRNACMELERSAEGKWVLSMGQVSRTFARLREIWEILIQEDWNLSDIFPLPKPERRATGDVTQSLLGKPRHPKRNPCIAPKKANHWDLPWWVRERIDRAKVSPLS